MKPYPEFFVLWIGTMPPLISDGDQYCEVVYHLEQFRFFVSKKVIFVCLAGNCGVIYGNDVKVCRQYYVHGGDAMYWSKQSLWSILQYDVSPLGTRSRLTPELDVLPNAIFPAVVHKIRLVLVCTAAFKIFCCFIWRMAVCVVVYSIFLLSHLRSLCCKEWNFCTGAEHGYVSRLYLW